MISILLKYHDISLNNITQPYLILTHLSVTRFTTTLSGEEEQVEETDHHSASNSVASTSSTVTLSAFSCSSGEAQRGGTIYRKEVIAEHEKHDCHVAAVDIKCRSDLWSVEHTTIPLLAGLRRIEESLCLRLS